MAIKKKTQEPQVSDPTKCVPIQEVGDMEKTKKKVIKKQTRHQKCAQLLRGGMLLQQLQSKISITTPHVNLHLVRKNHYLKPVLDNKDYKWEILAL